MKGPIELILFKTESCAACKAAERIVAAELGKVDPEGHYFKLTKYDLETEEGFREAARYGVETSPTIIIGGKRYDGEIGEGLGEYLARIIKG